MGRQSCDVPGAIVNLGTSYSTNIARGMDLSGRRRLSYWDSKSAADDDTLANRILSSLETLPDDKKTRATLVGEEYLIASLLKERPDFKSMQSTGLDYGGTKLQILEDMSLDDCKTKHPAWPRGYCERAINRIQTWIEDYKWTRAQNDLGAKFAADNCKSFVRKDNPVGPNCPALLEKVRAREKAEAETSASAPVSHAPTAGVH